MVRANHILCLANCSLAVPANPNLLVPVTVNACGPAVEVSISEPDGRPS